MNERIKELMNQAGTDTSGKWLSTFNAEKFAELIIQECMDVVRDINQEYDGGSTTVNAAEEIRGHFRVE